MSPDVNTLYAKLIAVLLAFATIVIAMTLFVMRMSQEAYRMEIDQRLFRPLAEKIANSDIVQGNRKIDSSLLSGVRDQLRPTNTAIDVYLLDAGGKVLASSIPADAMKLDRVELPPLQRCMETPKNLPILGDDPREPAKPKIFSVATLNGSGGYVYVTLNSNEDGDSFAEQLMKAYKVRDGMWLATGGLALTLLAGFFVLGFVTRPLRRLTNAMDEFRRTDFNAQPEAVAARLPSKDEIGRLGATFDQMAERIHTQVRDLKQIDTTRRELVANISHDLRTPLAAVQGYLETLLMKEEKLSAEEKRHYLEIAVGQTRRLTRLVAKLFELAKLDAEMAAIAVEPFMLPELVHDLVQKFALAAANKKIEFAIDFAPMLPPVVADIGLIERVLENLIENALRYTPAGGRIEIRLSRQAGMVEAQITDTGCGIPADELPRIFDRFYRIEKSRSHGADSAGLGLAIVKRILELHNAAISVKSDVGAGATFWFRLPVQNGR